MSDVSDLPRTCAQKLVLGSVLLLSSIGATGATGTSNGFGITGTDVLGITGTDVLGITGTDVLGITGTDVLGITGTDILGITGTADCRAFTGDILIAFIPAQAKRRITTPSSPNRKSTGATTYIN